MKKQGIIIFYLLLIMTLGIFSCSDGKKTVNEADAKQFVTDFEAKLEPLLNEYNLTFYLATISGSEIDYDKAAELQIEISKLYDKNSFETIKTYFEAENITDNQLKRQIEILYNEFIPYQIDEEKLKEMILLESKIQREFSIYRPTIDDKKIYDNDIENVLSSSKDSKELQKYWEASKEVGSVINEDLVKLVKMRNEVAVNLGYNNYHQMMLFVSGQNPVDVFNTFEQLDIMTEIPYSGLKKEIDEYLSGFYGVPEEELMPWHYQNRFFQEAPAIYNVDFDKYYENVDIHNLAVNYFNSVGLDMTDVLENSDLYPKEGKSQLAFTSDLDRNGDVRILANLSKDETSMGLILYEAGFGSSMKYIDKNLPYSLKKPAHFFISDAIGNLFQNLSQNEEWMFKNGIIDEAEKEKIKEECHQNIKLNKFIFSRWALVMYKFEKMLYENPDQDLNLLWWSLVAKYQKLNVPQNIDNFAWASKTHIITHPCTYHNYMLGELFSAQLLYYFENNLFKDKQNCLFDNQEIGTFLIENIFKYGSQMDYNDLLKQAVGEKLSADYFSTMYLHL